MMPDEILYRCGSFDWGAIGYAPLLAIRQYKSRQFVLATHGLAQSEFSYKGKNYKKKIREITNAWKQTRRMKTVIVGEITIPKYKVWLSKRVNENIPGPNLEDVRSVEECLQVIPTELEIIKQDFEKKNSEFGKKIEQLEEERMHLKLDVEVQKSEAEKLRKGKNKAEEDLDSLKTDYKKMRLSMRTVGLGKNSDQW
ncbi:golgin subfamily A member 5-like [Gossypium australe]|uniref:Golgin subfamily A member 5-like n=1 Tax=Gossypium australe TaxID=47621 RepID=A0A5B6X5A1_9ROSI|nr:golgin subfamily A member 5-like [Gossypium australe]